MTPSEKPNRLETSTVLFVDDDTPLRMMFRHILTREGYHCLEAETAENALEILRKLGQLPDLILMDAMLPGLDGFEACRQIRQLPEGASVPILMVTALEDALSIDQAFSSGASDLITKPINWALLRQRVQRMTGSRRTQKKLNFMEARSEGIISQLDEAVLIHGNDGQIESVNPAAERMFGLTADQLVGIPIGSLFMEPLPAESPSRQYPVMTGKRAHTTFPAEISMQKLGDMWELNILVVRDCTARVHAEEQRRQLEARLHQNQRLELLTVLSGGIAHDFNNVLTGVIAHADLAVKNLPANSVATWHLEELIRGTDHVRRLTTQMLLYAGKNHHQPKNLELNALLRKLRDLTTLAVPKSCQLIQELSEEPLPIFADPAQIEQIVMNLLLNSSDAIGHDPGTITMRTGTQWLEATTTESGREVVELPEGNYCWLEIEDTGHGIPSEVLPRVFEPFFTTRPNSRGLGLAMVASILRTHKGASRILSRPGRGTTFRCWLPRHEDDSVLSSIASMPAETAPESSKVGRMILVVDDEESIRTVVNIALTLEGYTVLVAEDGLVGLRLLEEHGRRISSVLLDLAMPAMDGETMLRELRRTRPDLPVILMTGRDPGDTPTRFEELNIQGILNKPFRIADLSGALSRMYAGK